MLGFPPVWVPVQSLESSVCPSLILYPLCVSLFRLVRSPLQIPRDLPCGPSWSRAVMDSRLPLSQSET